MSTETVLQAAAALLSPWTRDTLDTEPNRLDVIVAVDDLCAAITAMSDAPWGYLATITGVDLGVEAGELEALYHFCEGAAITTLRVRVPRDAAVIPSIFAIIPSVSFYERELIEMFGFTVEGTPNTDRLFTPDDWPDGVYPLRKDVSFEDMQAQGQ